MRAAIAGVLSILSGCATDAQNRSNQLATAFETAEANRAACHAAARKAKPQEYALVEEVVWTGEGPAPLRYLEIERVASVAEQEAFRSVFNQSQICLAHYFQELHTFSPAHAEVAQQLYGNRAQVALALLKEEIFLSSASELFALAFKNTMNNWQSVSNSMNAALSQQHESEVRQRQNAWGNALQSWSQSQSAHNSTHFESVAPRRSIGRTCYLSSEADGGVGDKICYYDCGVSTKAYSPPSISLCPISRQFQ